MNKFEDEAMDLIETVAENSHHNAAKPLGRGATPKGGLIDAKSVETGMLLEKIEKMAEVQNLLLDRFYIRNGSEGLAPIALQEASPCAHCSRLDPRRDGLFDHGNSRAGHVQTTPDWRAKSTGTTELSRYISYIF